VKLLTGHACAEGPGVLSRPLTITKETSVRIHRPPSPHSPWPTLLGAAAVIALLALTACANPRPLKGIPVVRGFDVDRYTGHWHEVARTDNRFERGLTQASAEYRRQRDGSLRVINRGFDPVRGVWKQVEGTARFVGTPTQAALKVSFFGPVYAGYNVVALDENYQWALVVGSSPDQLWVLSRSSSLPRGVRQHLMERAQALGIDTRPLVWAADSDELYARRRTAART
jgi:apolipoprotein D and lipocalin family protein